MGTIFFPLSFSFDGFALLHLLFLDTYLTCVAQNWGAAASGGSCFVLVTPCRPFPEPRSGSVWPLAAFPLPAFTEGPSALSASRSKAAPSDKPQKTLSAGAPQPPASSLCYWLISPSLHFSLYSLKGENVYLHEDRRCYKRRDWFAVRRSLLHLYLPGIGDEEGRISRKHSTPFCLLFIYGFENALSPGGKQCDSSQFLSLTFKRAYWLPQTFNLLDPTQYECEIELLGASRVYG